MSQSEPLPFWETKSLYEMTQTEWESLCDGCGQCCLHKMEDIDTGEIAVTNVACKLLDLNSCQCKHYPNRLDHVPDCVQLTPKDAETLTWLPKTCAYKLIADGDDLPTWHPLISGDPNTVHEAGISVQDEVVGEEEVEDLEEHVMHWLEAGNMPFNFQDRDPDFED
ncbi:YcgN family cysteine cluster protein [Curvivirga aplysinae]|uniref:YcgN family cysteine cluster protein n=1 Tax=Curvivirga aplysinae TaxID=2529852 RepID=UPI002E25BC63|nr:YcgN family cysteine cluster protein [Curvivirga aplysinae]